MENYAYHCGVIDAFNEVVKCEVKQMALSHPVESKQECLKYLSFVEEIAKKYGTSYYLEDALLLTDLFPVSSNQGKCVYLFYKKEETLQTYLRLKQEKQSLIDAGKYTDENRVKIAYAFGKLLSYGDEAIQQLIHNNHEKEVI